MYPKINFVNWNLIKSQKIKRNEFGLGINIYEENKPIYIPVLNVEGTNLHYIHEIFNNSFKIYLFFNSNNIDFEETKKIINILSKKSLYGLENNNESVIGSYLELLLLRKNYIEFNPKNPHFKEYSSLLNIKKFDTSFEILNREFENLNKISYEVHNSFTN